MTSWHELWARKQRADREANEADAAVANHLGELERPDIEDLKDPHGKRFLFDDFEGMAQQTTSPPERVLACNLRAPCATTSWAGRARFCAFTHTCERTCVWCALECARASGCPRSRVVS